MSDRLVDKWEVAEHVQIPVDSVSRWLNRKGIKSVGHEEKPTSRGNRRVSLYALDDVEAARDTTPGRGNRTPRTVVVPEEYGKTGPWKLRHRTPKGEAATPAVARIETETKPDGAEFFRATCETHTDGSECGFTGAWQGSPYGASHWWAGHLGISNYTIKGRRS